MEKTSAILSANIEVVANKDFTNEEVLSETVFSQTGAIQVLYTNADSLSNKINELQAMANLDKPDLICITETLPKYYNPDLYENFNLPGYEGFHANRGRGVSTYVKSGYLTELFVPQTDFTENVFVKISINSNTILLVGCIYRSPNSEESNNDALLALLDEANRIKCSHLIILGDFNYKEVNWELRSVQTRANHPASKILDKVNDLFLDQVITEPTRYRYGEQENLLDWVLTDSKDCIENLSIGSPLGAKGDHCIIKFGIKIIRKEVFIKDRRNLYKGDYDALRQIISVTNWKEALLSKTTEEAWSFFSDVLNAGIQKHIPLKKAVKSNCQIWVNSEVRAAKRNKNRFWQKYKRNKTTENWSLFTEARNAANRIINKTKSNFELKIAREIKTNSKQFWNYVKSKKVGASELPNIRDLEGNEHSSDLSKANSFNEYFSSVFTCENLDNPPAAPFRNQGQFKDNVFSSIEIIEKELTKLNISKAAGPDKLHAKILYELRKEISLPLNIIFNKSMNEGKLPPEWKLAHVKPLFKKGSKKDISNYRPVSLTSICCKLLERIIKADMTKYLEENKFIVRNQHGFRSGRSCVTQLLEIMNIWTEILDKNSAIDCVYLDFAKAFDKVPHHRLNLKMKSYGIGGNLLNWLTDFLDNRKQQVVIKDTFSDIKDVTSGIPQGSVLGPLLFIIYINDLPEAVNSEVQIFADDTKIFKAIETVADSLTMQEDLNNILEWSSKWQLPFNISKCKIIHFGKNNPEYEYTMTDNRLEKVDFEKDLGVTFDRNLKFSKHISLIVSKANSRLGMIKRNFDNLSIEVFLPLYKSLVRPLLEYCSSIWNPTLKMEYDEIEKVQRRATKLVTNLKNLSYQDRMRYLKLDSLAFRRRRCDIIQVFKIFKGIDKLNQQEFFTLNDRPTRGHSLKISKPRANSSLRQNSFSFRIVNDWNSLSESTVTCTSVNSFKSALSKEWRDHPERYLEDRS